MCGRIAHLRNVGLERVKTEWIAYLDDDNTWTPDHLEALIPYKDGADIVYTAGKRAFMDSTQSVEVQLDGVDPSACLINVAFAKRIGGWQEEWLPSNRGAGWEAPDNGLLFEDLDFWYRAMRAGARIVRGPLETWTYTPGPRPEPRLYESRMVRNWKLERPTT